VTSKERIRKSLSHAEPDRVPYDLSGTTVTAITKKAFEAATNFRNIPFSYEDENLDPVQQIVTPSSGNLQYLKSDTRRIGARRIPGYEEVHELRQGEIWVKDYFGCQWAMRPEKDLYFNQKSYPLEKDDFLTGNLHVIQTTFWPVFSSYLYKDLEKQSKQIRDFCCIADRHTAGFTENSMRLRGAEKWYLDTMMDESGVEALMDIILEDKIQYWDALIDWAIANNLAGQIDVVSECDDLGSQSLTILDPDYLRRTVIPRFKILFTHIKRRLPHVKTFMHSCGSIRPIIPDLIEAGLDILNPVQYTAANMDPFELKRDFGKDLVFWGGGVDTQTILNHGTPEIVSDEVKRMIDIMAPGGGFVFAPVHNIQNDVPPQNFWAMWDTLMEYGIY